MVELVAGIAGDRVDGDGRNEVGFVQRGVVPGGDAATTDILTTWAPVSAPVTRTITEADITVPTGFPQSLA